MRTGWELRRLPKRVYNLVEGERPDLKDPDPSIPFPSITASLPETTHSSQPSWGGIETAIPSLLGLPDHSIP